MQERASAMFGRLDRVERIKALVGALVLTEDELSYQVRRLEGKVKARTEEEAQYHAELREGYKNAGFHIRTLRRYHEGRLERILSGQRLEEEDGSITEGGIAQPYADDQ